MSIKSVSFSNSNKVNQAISFISAVLTDDNLRLKVKCRESDDVVYVDLLTENGVSISLGTLTGSEPFDGEAIVYAKDFCIAFDQMRSEQVITLFIAEGKLFVAGFYNEQIEGYELECGLKMQDSTPFNAPEELYPDDHLDIDQLAWATVADSLYDFEFVEIIRKNGVISFRTGDSNVTLATAMQSEASVGDDTDKHDLDIRVPAVLFKAIPMVNISNFCSVDVDTVTKRIKVYSDDVSMICEYQTGSLETTTSAGLVNFCTMDSVAISTTLDMIYRINHSGRKDIAELESDEGRMRVTVENDRVQLTITMGEVKMNPEFEGGLKVPLEILTMMVRNCQCNALTMKASPDGKTLMMCYSNGLYARKCTYIA